MKSKAQQKRERKEFVIASAVLAVPVGILLWVAGAAMFPHSIIADVFVAVANASPF